MRLRQRDLCDLTVMPRKPEQAPDGTTYETWEQPGRTIKASIQPAGGRLMAEMYGQRLANMLTLYAERGVVLKESDGVCVRTDGAPDYRVVAVRAWSGHLVADLERVK